MKIAKVSFMLLLVVFLVADVVLSEELEVDGKSKETLYTLSLCLLRACSLIVKRLFSVSSPFRFA